MNKSISRKRSFVSGQELLEYALTLPIFVLMVMGVLDLGRAVYYYSALHNATREGARYAIVHPCASDATILSIVKDFSIGLDLNLVVLRDPDNDGQFVEWGKELVQVPTSYSFTPVTPLIGQFLPIDPLDGKRRIYLLSSATMQRESWASPDCGS
jgi:Flp pilus assembly protein TadG